MYRRQESKPFPRKGNGKKNKAKWLSEEALQIAVKRREVKSKGEKERCNLFERNDAKAETPVLWPPHAKS